MDSSLEFAQRLLDQLRYDLKRLDEDRLLELHKTLGRSTSYFQRASPSSFRLRDGITTMRFLGFKPSEYIEKTRGGAFRTPAPLPGFFAVRRPKGPDLSGLQELPSFVEWGRSVIVDPGSSSSKIDIEAYLKAFGIEPLSSDFLRAADFVLPTFSAHRPDTIHPVTAKTLTADLCVIAKILMEQRHLQAACDLIDVGFHLDSFLADPESRLCLYLQAACLARRLELRAEVAWLQREASLLALLTAQFDLAVDTYHQYKLTLHGEDAGKERRLLPRRMVLEEGTRNSTEILKSLKPERTAFGAQRLDHEIGVARGFRNAITQRRPISVKQWHQMLGVLGLSPGSILRRVDAVEDLPPIRLGGSFEALSQDVVGPEVAFSFQDALRTWAGNVTITEAAEEHLGLEDKPGLLAHPFESYSVIVEYFESFHQTLPSRLDPKDAVTLSQMLLRLAYVTRRQWQLKAASDFLDAAFYLLDDVPVSANLGVAYRTAFLLPVDLGNLQLGQILLNRAIWIDLNLGNRAGLTLTVSGLGYLALVRRDFDLSIRLRRIALDLADWSGGRSLIPDIHQDIADTFLSKEDIRGASKHLRLIDPETSKGNPLSWAAHLSLKGEFASLSGEEAEAREFFLEGAGILSKAGQHRDLLLIKLRMYRHLKRFGRHTDAGRELLSMSALANRRDIPSSITTSIEELLHRELQGVEYLQKILTATMQRISHPYLSHSD